MRCLGAVTMLVAACAGEDGRPCTIQETKAGAVIRCPDGTTATFEDATGANDGPGSAGYRPILSILCSADLDIASPSGLGANGIDETGLRYDVTAFSNGDVLASCGKRSYAW